MARSNGATLDLWLVGMMAETALAYCSLTMGGVLDKYPELKIVLRTAAVRSQVLSVALIMVLMSALIYAKLKARPNLRLVKKGVRRFPSSRRRCFEVTD